MISEDIIADIRARTDIVAVIGQHVGLRKAGRNWKGLCPFHGEKSPSFNVNPDKGFFYCFGCRKKGDAFTFVMEYEGKSFLEAAEQLAGRAGVELPKVEESPEQRRQRSERTALLDINRLATEFFRETLRHPERGAPGREYLAKRGTEAATIERFQLGYGPVDWHLLSDYLKAKRVDMELAVKLGLIARQPRAGGYYDRYRDRLVCPVIVPGGEVVGFSARTVGAAPPPTNGSEPPKYINSPESPLYKKSRLLFGLAQARETLAQKHRAIVVEGNFDVISLHQAGFTETVAPLGTAFTSEQVEQLRRLTSEVILCYDGDRAGRSATRAALEVLVAAEVPVRVVMLPDGDDPDSFIKNRSVAELQNLVDRAGGGIEFLCFEVWGKNRFTADSQTPALIDTAKFVTKVANPAKRDLILGTLASAMNVDLAIVRREFARALAALGQREAPTPFARNAPGATGPNGPQGTSGARRFGNPGDGQRFGGSAVPSHRSDPSADRFSGTAHRSGLSNTNDPRSAPRGNTPWPNRNNNNRFGDNKSGGARWQRQDEMPPTPAFTPSASNRYGAPLAAAPRMPTARAMPVAQPDTGNRDAAPPPQAASSSDLRLAARPDAQPDTKPDPRHAARTSSAPSPGFDQDAAHAAFADVPPPDDHHGPSAPPWDDIPPGEYSGSHSDEMPPWLTEDAPRGTSASSAPSHHATHRNHNTSSHSATRSTSESGHASAPNRAPANPTRAPAPGPAPAEEIAFLALLADHPDLISSSQADKAVDLLTDATVRDMYLSARKGSSMADLAASLLPDYAVESVLSGRYATNPNPQAVLSTMLKNLQLSRTETELVELRSRMAEAQRRGDRELARQLAVAISNTRKQVV